MDFTGSGRSGSDASCYLGPRSRVQVAERTRRCRRVASDPIGLPARSIYTIHFSFSSTSFFSTRSAPGTAQPDALSRFRGHKQRGPAAYAAGPLFFDPQFLWTAQPMTVAMTAPLSGLPVNGVFTPLDLYSVYTLSQSQSSSTSSARWPASTDLSVRR